MKKLTLKEDPEDRMDHSKNIYSSLKTNIKRLLWHKREGIDLLCKLHPGPWADYIKAEFERLVR